MRTRGPEWAYGALMVSSGYIVFQLGMGSIPMEVTGLLLITFGLSALIFALLRCLS